MEDRRWIDGKKATHPTHPRRGGACVQLHRPGWAGLLTLLRRSRWLHLRIHLPETEKVDLSWDVGGQAAAANGAAFPGVRRSPCSPGKVSSDQPGRGNAADSPVRRRRRALGLAAASLARSSSDMNRETRRFLLF